LSEVAVPPAPVAQLPAPMQDESRAESRRQWRMHGCMRVSRVRWRH
jgi:hypothetical protein